MERLPPAKHADCYSVADCQVCCGFKSRPLRSWWGGNLVTQPVSKTGDPEGSEGPIPSPTAIIRGDLVADALNAGP